MKVLIVTYYWPPSGGGGVQRWLKFATNLNKLSCETFAYTPSNPDVPILDPSLVQDIPEGTTILSQPIFEPSRFLKFISGKLSTDRLGATGSSGKKSLLAKLSLWVRGNLFVPDARVGWVKPSVKYLSKWLDSNPVDVIITTGPPHSMHLIGLGVKAKYPKLPWIADFRDPWSDMDYLQDFHMGTKARKKLIQMEKDVVGKADRLIVTSRSAERQLLEGNTGISVFIPNGWDPEDYPKSQSTKTVSDTIRIGHFGSLHGSRNAPGLWKAIEDFKSQGKKVELVFAGNVSPEIREELKEYNCVLMGGLPHKEAVSEMLKCDALLLIHNNTDSATRSTPGKLFEYIATSKPIISICRSKGDLANMLDGFGLPHATHNDDSLALAMLQSFRDQQAVDPAPYTRMKQAEKLLEVIKSTQ